MNTNITGEGYLVLYRDKPSQRIVYFDKRNEDFVVCRQDYNGFTLNPKRRYAQFKIAQKQCKNLE